MFESECPDEENMDSDLTSVILAFFIFSYFDAKTRLEFSYINQSLQSRNKSRNSKFKVVSYQKVIRSFKDDP